MDAQGHLFTTDQHGMAQPVRQEATEIPRCPRCGCYDLAPVCSKPGEHVCACNGCDLYFDPTKTAETLKAEGMARAAESKRELLAVARKLARDIALSREDRTCHADLVAEAMVQAGITETLGNAAGSLFKTDDWKFTGQFTESTRPQSHRNLLRVWRLRDDR